MIQAAVDLHIHTALSPCADEEMTPNNIVNMAVLKGLDAIAIADHNTAGNVRAVCSAARETALIVIPAIEVQTAEDVHLVCFFLTVEDDEAFAKEIYASLPPLQNNPELFGTQHLLNANDELLGVEERMLSEASRLTITQVIEAVARCRGVCVPAHVDRPSFGLVGQLGFIPPEYPFKTVELTKTAYQKQLFGQSKRTYYASDAHMLGSILEPEMKIEIEALTASAVLSWLSGVGCS